MRVLFLLTVLSLSGMAMADECFLDYQSVCGKSPEGVTTYLNKCLMQQDSANQVSWAECETEDSRSPASVEGSVFSEAQQVENEIQSFLGENA